MSILTDLEVALEAKQEAESEHRLARRGNDHDEKVAAAECVNRAIDDFGSLLTDDTIAALIAVARAAEAVGARWYETDEMKVLAAALAPLVKEATDE